jgi:hemerythrin
MMRVPLAGSGVSMLVSPSKLKYIEWTQLSSVGNELLDTEHRHLVELINDLYEIVSLALSAGRLEPASRILEEILSYTDYHFRDEERLLVASSYPDIDAHLSQHRELRAETWELHKGFSRSPTRSEAVDILKFLRAWWMSHINRIDAAYAAHVMAFTASTP